MSTFMGLPDKRYFFHHPTPMPKHPTLGVIKPGTMVTAKSGDETLKGRVRYPTKLDIQGAEPDWFGLKDNDENAARISEEPWVVLAGHDEDGNEVELNVFLNEITERL